MYVYVLLIGKIPKTNLFHANYKVVSYTRNTYMNFKHEFNNNNNKLQFIIIYLLLITTALFSASSTFDYVLISSKILA